MFLFCKGCPNGHGVYSYAVNGHNVPIETALDRLHHAPRDTAEYGDDDPNASDSPRLGHAVA